MAFVWCSGNDLPPRYGPPKADVARNPKAKEAGRHTTNEGTYPLPHVRREHSIAAHPEQPHTKYQKFKEMRTSDGSPESYIRAQNGARALSCYQTGLAVEQGAGLASCNPRLLELWVGVRADRRAYMQCTVVGAVVIRERKGPRDCEWLS